MLSSKAPRTMTHRLLAVGAVLTLGTLSLTACGAGHPTPPIPTPVPPTTAPPTGPASDQAALVTACAKELQASSGTATMPDTCAQLDQSGYAAAVQRADKATKDRFGAAIASAAAHAG